MGGRRWLGLAVAVAGCVPVERVELPESIAYVAVDYTLKRVRWGGGRPDFGLGLDVFGGGGVGTSTSALLAYDVPLAALDLPPGGAWIPWGVPQPRAPLPAPRAAAIYGEGPAPRVLGDEAAAELAAGLWLPATPAGECLSAGRCLDLQTTRCGLCPPPPTLDGPACPDGRPSPCAELTFPAPFGCDADTAGFPLGVSASAYVLADAPASGDGSRERPFPTVERALEALGPAAQTATLALSGRLSVGDLSPIPPTFVGACPERARLRVRERRAFVDRLRARGVEVELPGSGAPIGRMALDRAVVRVVGSGELDVVVFDATRSSILGTALRTIDAGLEGTSISGSLTASVSLQAVDVRFGSVEAHGNTKLERWQAGPARDRPCASFRSRPFVTRLVAGLLIGCETALEVGTGLTRVEDLHVRASTTAVAMRALGALIGTRVVVESTGPLVDFRDASLAASEVTLREVEARGGAGIRYSRAGDVELERAQLEGLSGPLVDDSALDSEVPLDRTTFRDVVVDGAPALIETWAPIDDRRLRARLVGIRARGVGEIVRVRPRR